MLDVSNFLVAGIPLVLVVFGLVEMIKSLGIKGPLLTVLSMVIGLLLGMAFQVAQAGVPASFAAWFSVVIFGLTLGLVASGFYKWSDNRFPVKVG